ncbi:MAG TPA: hypothetical protein VLX92_08580, partial [Kofleriaceae bacterium]|nr:hypothetical protein [Kofleriaceae bacterium]
MRSRAAVRRALALAPDAERLALAAPLADLAGAGPLSPGEVGETFVRYLFDREAGAILATSDARARWLDGPLFVWVGPGNAAPLDDDIAALVAGPLLAKRGAIAPPAIAERFAPRADAAIAVALAALPPEARPRAFEQLAADLGPEPELLALSLVQCGRALAWSPELCDTPAGERVVRALIALLDPARPRPLLELVARVLGPLARGGGATAERIRAAAIAGMDRPASSLVDAIAAIARPQPGRDELAAACAYLTGRSAPLAPEAFALHRALV